MQRPRQELRLRVGRAAARRSRPAPGGVAAARAAGGACEPAARDGLRQGAVRARPCRLRGPWVPASSSSTAWSPTPTGCPTSADTMLVNEPATGSKVRTKGNLYLVVSSGKVGGRAREATALVADTIRREYYYDESAGIPICLEKAVRTANRKLRGSREGGGLPPGVDRHRRRGRAHQRAVRGHHRRRRGLPGARRAAADARPVAAARASPPTTRCASTSGAASSRWATRCCWCRAT